MHIVRLSSKANGIYLTRQRSSYYDLCTVKKLASIGIFAAGIPLALSFAAPAFAAGQEICQAAGSNFSALCALNFASNGGGVVGAIVNVLLIIAILISLFFLIMAGIRWMTSGGDQAKIGAARSQIIAALIGLVIAVSAFAIVNFVLGFITGQGLSGLKIPRLID